MQKDMLDYGKQVSKEERFRDFSKKIKNCKSCKGLNIKGITENSPGYGDINSKVMLVGQSLCEKCIQTQIPFTGGSGLILDRLFKDLEIEKKDIFITNILACHPPNNRPSFETEKKNCSIFLNNILKIVQPKLCILIGRDAIEYFVPEIRKKPLKGFVNKKVYNEKYNCYVLPVYHTAWVYRNLISKKFMNDYIYNTDKIKFLYLKEYLKPMEKIIKEYI